MYNLYMKKIFLAITLSISAALSYAYHPKHGIFHHRPLPPRHHAMPPPYSAVWNAFPKPPPPAFVAPPPRPIVSAVWIQPVYEIRPMYDQFGRFIGYQRVLVSQGYWQY